jgi:hypothetical protein
MDIGIVDWSFQNRKRATGPAIPRLAKKIVA